MLDEARNVYFVQETLKGICRDLRCLNYGNIFFPFRYLHVNDDKFRSQWPRGLNTKVCGRSPAEIVGSNPIGGIDVCLL